MSSEQPAGSHDAAFYLEHLDLLETDTLVSLAARELGLNRAHLLQRSQESFTGEDPEAPAEIIELRWKHHQERRLELASQLAERHANHVSAVRHKGRRPASAQVGTGDGGAATDDSVEAKLAADRRKLDLLARRRDEEITKMVDFQLKMRKQEQRNAEQRELEMRQAEEAKLEAQRRAHERLEVKRRAAEARADEARREEERAERIRKAEAAKARERAHEDAVRAKHAAREARRKEEERKAMQRRRQEATQALFERHEQTVRQRAAEADERKRQSHARFMTEQAQRNCSLLARQQKARERVEQARVAQERLAEERRRQFDERERAMALRKEEEARRHAQEVADARERQLAMALRRGRILEEMKSQESHRVYSLIDRISKQEEAMEAMTEQRQRMIRLREEQNRLRMADRKDNIGRMMAAKDFYNERLRQKFEDEDERESQRRTGKAALVEANRMASLEAGYHKKLLEEKLARARGFEALEKLSQSVHAASATSSSRELSGEGGDSAPRSQQPTPRPPNEPRVARPATARARMQQHQAPAAQPPQA